MFCPSCGQEQISEETSFCSRCGLLLTGVTEILNLGGAVPQALKSNNSKKKFFQKKGFKQGLFIFLLSFVIVAILSILTVAADADPYVVIISAILFSGGGLLRMAYSLMFEADESSQTVPVNQDPAYFASAKSTNALPPGQSIPASTYARPRHENWRDTNDLSLPSVTEGTTKLLKEDDL